MANGTGRLGGARMRRLRRLTAALLLAWALPAAAEPELSQGETVYVPVYSHIWHGNRDGAGEPARLLLSAMLSIRNIDPDRGLTIRSVRYYDNDGKLLRDFYAQPKQLGPLGSTDVFVENKDSAGGTGANFLVVWDAEAPVNRPIIETVHAYFVGTQSVAFTSVGRVVSRKGR